MSLRWSSVFRVVAISTNISSLRDWENGIRFMMELIKMRISYDSKYDILYLKLGNAEKVLCKDVDEDITIDVDAQGKLVGIEVLSASEHLDLSQLLPVEITKDSLK